MHRGPALAGGAALAVALGVLPCPGRAADDDPRIALVKIYSTRLQPDYWTPWGPGSLDGATGSGFVIADHRILTAAHLVDDSTLVQVRRYGESVRREARVLWIAPEADLALLTVDDHSFFEEVAPLSLGDLPQIQTEVTVLGFPMGGDSLSVTRGVVSRIEHEEYLHSSHSLLAGQIDAAVNPGNSGGPVLVDGRVVGVVSQKRTDAENMSFMVPVTLIRHFIEDVRDGRYDGFPELGLWYQAMDGGAARAKYKVPAGRAGVLVLRTAAGSASQQLLKAGDVLLSLDGQVVASDGTVELRSRERTALSLVPQGHQVGETLRVEYVRDGRVEAGVLSLNRSLGHHFLVPREFYGRRPRYFAFSGLVFAPLTLNMLKIYGDDWMTLASPEALLALDKYASFEGEEVVVLQRVLADSENEGYHGLSHELVSTVDGQHPRNLADALTLVERGTEPYLTIGLVDGQQVIVDRARGRERGPGILGRYGVGSDRSEDLTHLNR